MCTRPDSTSNRMGWTTCSGTCTTPSRVPTGWVTRTPSNTCAGHANDAVYELEHYGVPFSRTGGRTHLPAPVRRHDPNFGEGPPAQRTCAAADRTGHAMLHTLYGQSLRHSAQFFIEYFAIDLIVGQDGACGGIVALCLEDGTLHRFRRRRRSWRRRLRPHLLHLHGRPHPDRRRQRHGAARRLPLQDMEFIQFHPTGIYGAGMLITEGARGEGGYLTNANGERFMERYARTPRTWPRATWSHAP